MEGDVKAPWFTLTCVKDLASQCVAPPLHLSHRVLVQVFGIPYATNNILATHIIFGAVHLCEFCECMRMEHMLCVEVDLLVE